MQIIEAEESPRRLWTICCKLGWGSSPPGLSRGLGTPRLCLRRRVSMTGPCQAAFPTWTKPSTSETTGTNLPVRPLGAGCSLPLACHFATSRQTTCIMLRGCSTPSVVATPSAATGAQFLMCTTTTGWLPALLLVKSAAMSALKHAITCCHFQ